MAPGTMLLYLFAMMMTVTVVKCQCDSNTAVDECKSIHDALESALISPRNLYLLRETFEPVYHPPNVILVFYDVQFDKNETSKIEIGWSSSGFYSYIDPVTLLALQSGLVMAIATDSKFSQAHFYNITLVLDVHDSRPALTANSRALRSVLNRLTTRLKAYATAQGKLIHWDGSDKGFIWECPENHRTLVALLIPIALITLVVLIIVIMFTPGIIKVLTRVHGSRNKVLARLFWGSLVTVFLVFELGQSNELNYYAFTAYPHIQTLRSVVDWTPVGLGMLVGIGTGIQSGFPTPVFLLYSLEPAIYYIFILLITVRALPTLLLAFLYPLEVISVTVSVTAIVVFYPLLCITPLILLCSLFSFNCKKNGRIMCYSLLFLLVDALVLWISVLNMAVLKIGTNTSGVMQLLLSLITSVVMAMCGYLMKRVFLGKKSIFTLIKDDNKEDNTQEKDVSMTHTQTDNADPELQSLVVDGNMDTEP